MSDQSDTYESARITVTRNLSDDGDKVLTEWTEDAPLIELLGMVEFARDAILRAYKTDDEETE